MDPSRRSFMLKMAAAAAAAMTTEIDPERLLWVPGQKTFFLPPEKAIIKAEDAVVREILDQREVGRIVSPWEGARYIVTLSAPVSMAFVGDGTRQYKLDTNWQPLGSPQEREAADKAMGRAFFERRRGDVR